MSKVRTDPFRVSRFLLKRLLHLCLATIALLGSAGALGQNAQNTYSGSGTGNVTTGSNWSLGHVPTITEDAVFSTTSNSGIKNFGGGATVGSPLTVGSLNVTATSGTYSIRNNTSSATNASITLGGVGNLGNSVSGTSSDLLYAATGSTLALIGPNGSTGSGVLNIILGQSGNFNAAGTINVSSVISDGGANYQITQTGAGTLNLSGANTYGGGLTLSTGTLGINNNSALGTGTFTISGGTITNTSGAAVTVANNAQTWAGNFTAGVGSGTSDLNLGNGTVNLSGNRTINVSGLSSTFTVGGVIGDAGNGYSLTKATGTGTMVVAGANTYSGGTTVSAGTLIVANTTGSGTGTGAVIVNGSGTLSGTGFINSGANAITINGTLSPGAAAAASNPGTINLASSAGVGALTLASTSTLMFDLGTTKDLVALTSTGLTLGGGTLALNLGAGFSYANTYTLFSGASSQTGSFGTVTGYDTSNYAAMFNYTGTDYNISFTPVPEPSTWAAGILTLFALGYTQRRRFKARR